MLVSTNSRNSVVVYFSLNECICKQSPLGQLKDLVELKDQLEDIQRRVEDEIQAGVPPVRLTVTNILKLRLNVYLVWILSTARQLLKHMKPAGVQKIKASLTPLLLTSLGRQSAGFSFPEGLSCRLRRCTATFFSSDGCCCGNVYRNVCSTKLRCSQHWKHSERLHTQPERRKQMRL